MKDSLVLQQLQNGLIEFDTAFTLIAARARRQVAVEAALAEPLVRRSDAGRVLLVKPEQIVEDDAREAPAPERPRIALTPVEMANVDDGLLAAIARPAVPPASVAAREVVDLSFRYPGVALVALQDEAHSNMLTSELSEGLARAFRSIASSSECRVVVVKGGPNWFCAGGSPELLAAIRHGSKTFLDDPIFNVLLECPLPTIAAIEGHALGGGLTFGFYADLIVLAKEAWYAANFMDHGFTPGVGATFLFPHKLGPVLGAEMLLAGRRYQGRELAERGAPLAVLPREEVLSHALDLAERLAGMPRPQLVHLKACLTEPIRSALPDVLRKEQQMHDAVFAPVRRAEGA